MTDVPYRTRGGWISERRGLRPWVLIARFLLIVAVIIAGIWWLISSAVSAISHSGAQQRTEQATHISAFTATLHTGGWEITDNKTDVYDGTISAYVVFGDCRDVVKATAPYDNPADVNIVLPWESGRVLDTVAIKLVDAPYAKVKQLRGNYALRQCSMEPLPDGGDTTK